MDKNYNRIEYKDFAPLDAVEIKKIEDRLKANREEMMTSLAGKPSTKKHNSSISKAKADANKRNFKKNGDTALKKFICSYQKELNYASYEKIFYIITEEDIIRLFAIKGFWKVTESIVKENYWEKETRKRYYVQYDSHQEFIKYLNEIVIPPFKKDNKALDKEEIKERKQKMKNIRKNK